MGRAGTTAVEEKPADDSAAVASLELIESIIPWAGNPYVHTSEQVREIVRSIRRFGWGEVILVRKANREIIAGHGRFLAAKRMKMARVPVRFMDISESEAHALALADNEIAKAAQRDDEAMATALKSLEDAGEDIAYGIGLDDDDIDKLLASDDDDEPKRRSRALGLKYKLVIECDDEEHQAKLLERFDSEGLSVKPLIS